jgi:hypothetical protein
MENILAKETVSYIPSSFTLGSHNFKVVQYKELSDDDESLYGQFDYENLTISIRIYKEGSDQLLSKEIILNSFYHELFHSFNYLWNTGVDESLASTFAMLMCEFNNTKKYGQENASSH